MDLATRIQTKHDLDDLSIILGNEIFGGDDVKFLQAAINHMTADTQVKIWKLFTPYVMEYIVAVDDRGLDFNIAKQILIDLAHAKNLDISSDLEFQQLLDDAKKALL